MNSDGLSPIITELVETGRDFHRRGWSLATSSNYSVVLNREPLRLLLTASGFDKGRLNSTQFVVVDRDGILAEPSPHKASAETMLHVVLGRSAGAGAILHTHSVWGTLLSEAFVSQGSLRIAGYEMLKAFSGITTHETAVTIDVFPNSQDIASLAQRVESRLKDRTAPLRHGFLISGHGLYTWGRDLPEARRHVEAFEFLFEILGRKL